MISKRLLETIEFIKGFNCLADCGTDHGYLPIYAVENGLVSRAYASDNKKYPLENARRNIESEYLEDKIELVLSNGLSYLNKDIDLVTILGLGGRSIAKIISEANMKYVKRIILSPNSEQAILREYLENNNWNIIAESFVKDKGKYYQIIVCEPGKMKLNKLEREFGPYIIKQKSPEFIEFVESLIDTLKEAIKKVKNQSEANKLIKRINELKEVI